MFFWGSCIAVGLSSDLGPVRDWGTSRANRPQQGRSPPGNPIREASQNDGHKIDPLSNAPPRSSDCRRIRMITGAPAISIAPESPMFINPLLGLIRHLEQ